MDGIEQPEAQELAEPGDRPQAGPRRGLRLRGRCEDGQRPVAAPRVVVAQPRAVDCEALLHRGRGTPLGDTVAVRFGGDLRPHLRPGRLTLGLLDVREQLRACAPPMRPPPEPVAGRPHGGRIDRGLREQAAAAQHGAVLGVHLVVLGLAPLERFPRQGVAQDTRPPCLAPQVGEPVPGKGYRSGWV